MQHFQKETLLPCSVEEAFDFHQNPENLTKISPPWIKTTLLKPIKEIAEGSVIEVKAVRALIPMVWKVRIKSLQRPTTLVDEALQSPFTYWCHTHAFWEVKEGTIMIDSVDFKMPLGFMGGLFGFLVQKDLEKMFTYRHQKTAKLLFKGQR